MLTLIRALTYAVLFITLVIVLLPAQVMQWAGVTRPAHDTAWQVAGTALVVLGGVLAISCVVTFALEGRGTPAPFDPPRRLVRGGPYRFVRNPMYWGAFIALVGAALFYESPALAGYAFIFLGVIDRFVRWYEEPTLRRLFGEEYAAYFREVGRWWPIRRG
ncbi:MAG TPA: PEMT/PEM2 methyltransferase family protein [Candidatus Eisenbacteria bacterium]|jgi:protein-S-isoprenylcysteine O-methyltransferase Ste14